LKAIDLTSQLENFNKRLSKEKGSNGKYTFQTEKVPYMCRSSGTASNVAIP